MNILVINLTRFGDLLQLQPAILGLEAQGHKVCLICLENFYAATSLMRGLHHVMPLPGAKFLSGLDKDWRLALSEIEAVIHDLDAIFPVHMVINTTSTLGARLLAKRIASARKNVPILGFGLDADGFGISGDMWATFLQGASAERLNCPFNLVDMFRSVCKVGHMPSLWGLNLPTAQVQEESLELIKQNMPDDCKGFVGIQLGASNVKRQWPAKYFAKLGASIWREHKLCPILLGTKNEQHLEAVYAEAVQDYAHPYISVMGKTDIVHLAGVLIHCKLLITNDTGTMHLAAGLKIPVLGIFLATAQAWDTGPYMPNCCCVEPAFDCHPCAFHRPCVHGDENQPCLKIISADTMYFLANAYLQHGEWPRLEQSEARIWRSTEEPDGFAALESLSGHEQEERTQWLLMQRHFYRQILDNEGHITSYSSKFLSPTLRQNVGTTMQQGAALLLLIEKQVELTLSAQGNQSGERMLVTCNKLHALFNDCHYLKALAHLWATLSQEQGGDLNNFLALVKALRNTLVQWHLDIEKIGT